MAVVLLCGMLPVGVWGAEPAYQKFYLYTGSKSLSGQEHSCYEPLLNNYICVAIPNTQEGMEIDKNNLYLVDEYGDVTSQKADVSEDSKVFLNWKLWDTQYKDYDGKLNSGYILISTTKESDGQFAPIEVDNGYKLSQKYYDDYYCNVTYGVFYPILEPIWGYSVTYTDGVEGVNIFTDQSTAVEGGAATPAFIGTPSREGYTFDGWNPAVADTVTESVTYTAKWKKLPCSNPDCTCGTGCTGDDCGCKDTTNSGGEGDSATVKISICPFGRFTVPKLFTISFNANGGDPVQGLSRAFGTTVNLANIIPTREGYTFTGWYADYTLTKNVQKVVVGQSMVLYAGWEPIVEEEEVTETETSETVA